LIAIFLLIWITPKAHIKKSPIVCNSTYQTFEELEAVEEIAAGNEPKRAKELRALKAHISRREYLDSLTAGASLMCIKKKEKKKGYLERKELLEHKQRMEYSESLTNIEPKTPKELKKLKKEAEHLAHMESIDSRVLLYAQQRSHSCQAVQIFPA
jgi:translation elongation factor EF-G